MNTNLKESRRFCSMKGSNRSNFLDLTSTHIQKIWRPASIYVSWLRLSSSASGGRGVMIELLEFAGSGLDMVWLKAFRCRKEKRASPRDHRS